VEKVKKHPVIFNIAYIFTLIAVNTLLVYVGVMGVNQSMYSMRALVAVYLLMMCMYDVHGHFWMHCVELYAESKKTEAVIEVIKGVATIIIVGLSVIVITTIIDKTIGIG